ncbi:sialic acid TRAP transporter substrate-binding protein SiaP [Neorhizobium galegae]|uniref:sialic acid TRAP transporter substrate-binding protein SiaP n=1 Tax=Neorhizobium galegae TaxID=399 RepID=UPI000621B1FC|nr:sialic acid TRAP transporter substrate-binding protein SiaP [Neorhizobium galegae]CDZ26492.1 Sialic acid-binding periplasmic protein SiaP [Neorhizobium galegae bv. officinalis]KAA9383467.1 C4-dicarboxylate ABC transporter [Neorhizobium galegae]MCM2500180.1 sialic acid TRAP transporter substrate-binding protein SiaP [Neorhizobium galegae]MCQ1768513.1 sialic acid TRAP transporter substrate-binding protein SiaP [Neorhizobium galegae]MCQ1769680.1 sialic acid TRAP transporter substrate-binding p
MQALSRRHVLAGAAAVAASAGLPGAALAATKLRFADVTTADAPRSLALTNIFAKEMGSDYEFQGYFGSTLFKQGTELVAVQRGNLEMAMLPPSDFAKQAPEFDILGAAYVVRDADHLNKIFESDVGEEFRKTAREKLKVEILAPAYYGARHVNLKGNKKVSKPEDLASVKLRMPGGESWQFLGKAIGANPVAMDYAEVYTGLQTGAIDAQDNPLPNDKLMKFYEVTNQIVLTGHNVGFGMLLIGSSVFDKLPETEQKRMRDVAKKAFAWSTAEYLKQESELIQFFKDKGLEVYEPDVAAFRDYAQKQYAGSPLSSSWPRGMIDRINKL